MYLKWKGWGRYSNCYYFSSWNGRIHFRTTAFTRLYNNNRDAEESVYLCHLTRRISPLLRNMEGVLSNVSRMVVVEERPVCTAYSHPIPSLYTVKHLCFHLHFNILYSLPFSRRHTTKWTTRVRENYYNF